MLIHIKLKHNKIFYIQFGRNISNIKCLYWLSWGTEIYDKEGFVETATVYGILKSPKPIN